MIKNVNFENLKPETIDEKDPQQQNILIKQSNIIQEHPRIYAKVKQASKDKLCHEVFQKGQKIIEVAKRLGIKYATAKTVIYLQRKKKQKKRERGTKYCGISSLQTKQIKKLRIISMSYGRINNIVDHQYSLEENIIIKIPD